jgi:hypothetical protein
MGRPPTVKKKHAAGRRWIVEGYDGTRLLERETLAQSRWPEPRITELLRRLVSRHLTFSDVVDGSRAPRDQFYNLVLKDHRDTSGKRLTISVGENPHYIASLWQADELDE